MLRIIGYNCRSIRTLDNSFNLHELRARILKPFNWDVVILLETWLPASTRFNLQDNRYSVIHNTKKPKQNKTKTASNSDSEESLESENARGRGVAIIFKSYLPAQKVLSK